MLKNEAEERNEAFAAAALKARASAEAIARALNLQVIGVLQAQSVEAAWVHPLAQVAGSFRTNVPTPVETRSLEIRETVVVTLQIQ